MVYYAIDVIHPEKNVCEALIGTLLDIPGKTKDTLKALDLEKMKLRKDLHHETLENGSKNFQQLTTPVRVVYPGYHGPPVTAQNSEYDMFPPATNGWGTMHLVPGDSPTTPG
jgi:hypothetical protein